MNIISKTIVLAVTILGTAACASETDEPEPTADGEENVLSSSDAIQSCGGACKRMGFTCGGRLGPYKGRTVCFCNYHNGSGRSCLD